MSAEGECLDEENALSYFSDELEPEHRAQIERHVDGCAACARLLSAMTEMRVENAPKNDEAPAERLAKVQERYTVLSEHGRGGQARILLAFDEKVGREVALKELLPPGEGSTDDPSWRDAMARFLREAELTGQLVHPGVVPVFDIGSRPDGSLYYTMQLVRGRTLSEVLRERPALPERLSLLGHFVSICQAVAYAHSRGVIHRDIKPQNVMVGEFGETVLLDWGLATQRGDKPSTMPLPPRANASAPEATREGAIIGTPGYMSPEQMSGRLSEVDASLRSRCGSCARELPWSSRGLPKKRSPSTSETAIRKHPSWRKTSSLTCPAGEWRPTLTPAAISFGVSPRATDSFWPPPRSLSGPSSQR
jgi:serine/threonine protein kinase